MADRGAGAELLDNRNKYNKTNNIISGFRGCSFDLVLIQNWGEDKPDKPSVMLFKELDRVGPSSVFSCEKVTVSSDMLYKELDSFMMRPRELLSRLAKAMT